jgi:hypothetical protein
MCFYWLVQEIGYSLYLYAFFGKPFCLFSCSCSCCFLIIKTLLLWISRILWNPDSILYLINYYVLWHALCELSIIHIHYGVYFKCHWFCLNIKSPVLFCVYLLLLNKVLNEMVQFFVYCTIVMTVIVFGVWIRTCKMLPSN